MKNNFLPVTMDEVNKLGWAQPDFVFVTGDAYIDHPSFGTAIIARVLEKAGYKVAILPQPNWKDTSDFKRFGRPRLGFLVNSGNIDSMVNHYTAQKKSRSEDAYTPGGRAGVRPDRAVIVYCNRIREAYKRMPIIIGGIEASLRRFAHFDYWDNKVRRSILIDACADILSYGMGERAIVEIANLLNDGIPIHEIHSVSGTAYIASDVSQIDCVLLPSSEIVSTDYYKYNEAFLLQQQQAYDPDSKILAQQNGRDFVVVNPPAMPLMQKEMDQTYALPFMRQPHPSYKEPIPALLEVSQSITSCRGCFGSCAFCALTYHQGRVVTSRSHQSILEEAKKITHSPDFKGYIHDVGGPTANFRNPACALQRKGKACKNRQCLFPTKCEHLEVTHQDYVNLLRKLREIPDVKKVFIRSGLRYDYILYDKDQTFMRELIEHHVSGQLKIAPEHIDDHVLELMGKPPAQMYERFVQKYTDLNQKLGKDQYIVPYFMSSHPGSDMNAAIALACYMKEHNIRPEQVQDFYPTPGTLATAMFFTGMDPNTGKKVYVPRDAQEKRLQRALLQYYRPQNAALVRAALIKAQREDLIGNSKSALVRPASNFENQQIRRQKEFSQAKNESNSSNKKYKTASNSFAEGKDSRSKNAPIKNKRKRQKSVKKM